ncbi:SGNH hydrolase [Anaeromyces robustus]|uniref:SGNH hydrolase n=1 Tax=Anaeromyces robustus TaxID=1754192 RepID=A0A1Y1XD65_9FUNG|nr:SGNH hydrolase [Anaeromyces robustus]|eukprot:ORX83710.1 SGNH hydrolase [Anaeromyces robustus]
MKLIQFIPAMLALATSTLAQFGGGGFGGGGFGGGGFGGGGFGGGDFGGFGSFGGGDMNGGNNNGGGAVAVSGDAIKIMPVGDSITFGMGENGGYRKYLYSALTQKGYNIDMVGPEGSSRATANGISYDDNHAGYSGFQIKEIPDWGRQQGGDGSLYNKLKSKNAVKQAQPDIILLIIGTNDMTANRSMDACASDLRALLDYMLGDMPSGGIIFMGSIPEFTAYGGNAQRVANYNGTVKKVAEEYASKGKNVRFADVHGSLNGTGDLGGDGLHPNGNGYKKMGNFWADIILSTSHWNNELI